MRGKLTAIGERHASAVLLVVDGDVAELLVHVFLVVDGVKNEGVEGGFIIIERLAVRIVQVCVGGNVIVLLVAAGLRVALEGDVDR